MNYGPIESDAWAIKFNPIINAPQFKLSSPRQGTVTFAAVILAAEERFPAAHLTKFMAHKNVLHKLFQKY